MSGYTIEHQPGAAPGYEWFWEVPWPGKRSLPASTCGTASTREEAEAGAKADLQRLRRSQFGTQP